MRRSFQPPQNIKGYQYSNNLGEGANGIVCKYIKDGKSFTFKMQKSSGSCVSLTNESVFLRKMQEYNKQAKQGEQFGQFPRLPQWYGDGQFKIENKLEKGEFQSAITVSYIILEYFEQTLDEYYKLKVNLLGIEGQIQMLEEVVHLIQNLHAYNYVHCDIKPDNFMVKKDEKNENHIYLIDFGPTHQFKQEQFDDKQKIMLKGTPLTASIHTIQGLYSSQGDDLISALYSLLILSLGQKIPWHDLCIQFDQADRKHKFYDLIYNEKVKLQPDPKIYGKFENALISQIKNLENLRLEEPLKYTTQIDYDQIINEVKLE
ncbi:ck1 family protein kinase [Stylonychia lemnae]|uniref:Casein kinase I n=1 Tax=Stylonychia lemnae TaxID=5949 RepID=A0A078B886_STYLE|nr:ck1 family protein kinase [Stylonychia lemnae]|eukprot:CDW90619.1 ck1 family protein kinase [Stylonychia lemnae]